MPEDAPVINMHRAPGVFVAAVTATPSFPFGLTLHDTPRRHAAAAPDFVHALQQARLGSTTGLC